MGLCGRDRCHLDEGDGDAAGGVLVEDLFADAVEELVREAEYEDVGTPRSGHEVRVCNDVGRELYAGHIFDVFVVLVDDICQLAPVDYLLEHPHPYLVREHRVPLAVGADDASYCAGKIS